ncbi:flagellar hook-length control protein FliK [Maritimibacter sp. UBA3975]|uniref:flagellar hook-length control protein FliK n=1 Tax=Maritimibacter sp. UBA3975 TaxID=1946833 RepID=UPI0025C54044|nr:flagellar hook-length control protein FliK [Maritimibacter sp. UBA3975]
MTTTLHAPSLKPAVVTTAAIVPVATNPQPTHADTALLTQASPNAADAATTVVAAPVARTGQASSLPLMSALGQPQEIAGRSGSTETTDALVKARSAPAPQRHSPEVTQGPSQPVGPPAPPTVPQTKGEEPTATPEADIEISQAGREGAFRTETTTPTPPTPSAAPPPTQLAAGEARVPVAEVPTDTLVAEVAGIDPLRSERPSAPTQPPNPGLLAQPETARSVAAQVADVVRAGREGTVEVTLRPEELGRVSLSFNTDGGALTVSLTADRPETLDLLRRNISLLEQELRQLGYDSLDFAFSDGSARGNDAGSRETSGTATSDQADTTQPDARTTEVLRHTSSGGMDLRL